MQDIYNLPIAELVNNINDENDSGSSVVVAERATHVDVSGNINIITALFENNAFDRGCVDLIISIRKDVFNIFWIIILINTVYFIVNPFAIIYFSNLILNLCTIKLVNPIMLETAIMYNFFVCILTFLFNIVLSVNLSYLSIYIFKLPDIINILWLYYLVLFFLSFMVILMYVYLIQKMYKLLHLRINLTDRQILLLVSML